MKASNTLLLAALFIASLFTACSSPSEDTIARAEALRKKIETDQRDLEVYQIFAAAEVKKNLAFARQQPELKNSSFVKVVDEFKILIPVQQNINLAKIRLTDYLNSENYKMDAIHLSLPEDFASTSLAKLDAVQMPTTQLKAISEIVGKIAMHKSNARTGALNRLVTQRLNNLNGDTIELKQNKGYLFPTDFFLNHEASAEGQTVEVLEPTFVKGGSEVGSIEKTALSIPIKPNSVATATINIELYIKTIE